MVFEPTVLKLDRILEEMRFSRQNAPWQLHFVVREVVFAFWPHFSSRLHVIFTDLLSKPGYVGGCWIQYVLILKHMLRLNPHTVLFHVWNVLACTNVEWINFTFTSPGIRERALIYVDPARNWSHHQTHFRREEEEGAWFEVPHLTLIQETKQRNRLLTPIERPPRQPRLVAFCRAFATDNDKCRWQRERTEAMEIKFPYLAVKMIRLIWQI